jgi:hypothetical protein
MHTYNNDAYKKRDSIEEYYEYYCLHVYPRTEHFCQPSILTYREVVLHPQRVRLKKLYALAHLYIFFLVLISMRVSNWRYKS